MSQWGVIEHLAVGFGRYAFAHNRILSCGYQATPAIGFGASQLIGELAVESCEIMNTGVSPDDQTVSTLCLGLVADLVLEARVQSNLIPMPMSPCSRWTMSIEPLGCADGWSR
ncbi:MAG: hypothetical protein U0231_12950 [Nitrospiraceae bacterium]